jgi:hypothetical protein
MAPLNGIQLNSPTLGKAWFELVQKTVQMGSAIQAGMAVSGDRTTDTECIELLEVKVVFPAAAEMDAFIDVFADRGMMATMEKVFFTDGPNPLGHSYAKLMHGPDGRSDLEDVISLLRTEPVSKRAVVSFSVTGERKVPCINTVQFLVRSGQLQTIYFSRGQDAFKKFYADALCLAKMARRVADALHLPAGTVTGFITSSHIYVADRPAIDDFLKRGGQFLENGQLKGAA